MGKLEALGNAIRKELVGKTINNVTIEAIHTSIIRGHIVSHLPEDEDEYSMENWISVTIDGLMVDGYEIARNDDENDNKNVGKNYSPRIVSVATFDISYDKDNEANPFKANLSNTPTIIKR